MKIIDNDIVSICKQSVYMLLTEDINFVSNRMSLFQENFEGVYSVIDANEDKFNHVLCAAQAGPQNTPRGDLDSPVVYSDGESVYIIVYSCEYTDQP